MSAGSIYYGHYLKNSQSSESLSTRAEARRLKLSYNDAKSKLQGVQQVLAGLAKEAGMAHLWTDVFDLSWTAVWMTMR